MAVGMGMIVLLLVFGADQGGGSRVEKLSELENAAPPAALNNSTHNSSRGEGSGGGVNVLAAILVTASSVMVFMAFRLSICRCRKSSSSSDGSNAEEDLTMEEIQTGLDILNPETPMELPASAADEKKKKKQLSLRVDWIENFTTLVEYRSLSLADSNLRCCSVCLCEFSSGCSGSGDEVRLLPACKHFFHPDCIDLWLLSHMSCPVCRRSVIPSRNFGDEVGSSLSNFAV